MTTESQPIACALGAADLRDRLAWIADLTRDALQNHRRDGPSLHLRYMPEAVSRVREMVRKESICCAFLTFEMHEQADAVLLTIKAPDSAGEAAAELFHIFVTPAPARQTRGCSSGLSPDLATQPRPAPSG